MESGVERGAQVVQRLEGQREECLGSPDA